MENAVILAARRTAIGAFGGALAALPASQLGATVIRSLLDVTGLAPDMLDEVILGQVLAAGCGQNPARQAAIAAGVPDAVPSYTINKVCGSGLKAVALAAQAVRCGDAELIAAGGQENMSLAPHVLPNSRTGMRMGPWQLADTMIVDGLTDAFHGYHMGITAENIADRYDLTREAQDAFAATSQQRTERAQAEHRFSEEICPVSIPQRKGEPLIFGRDEFPRPGVTAESLAKLKPAFRQDGSVTAANASGINDGAAAVLVASARRAQALGRTPLATIRAYASAGVDPAVMGTGPIPAVRRCLDRAGWSIADLDLVEANEAFAAQALCVNRELGLDPAKVNVNGGAIALGHPIAASGARLLLTLAEELRERSLHAGMASLCIGGGQGQAIVLEAA